MELFDWMEQSRVGVTVREILWVYPTLLVVHAVGLAFAVGVNVAIALRVLGVARALPVAPLKRFLPALYVAFVLNAVSGIGLVFNNPSKWLVDPVFYTKMAFLLLAMVNLQILNRRLLGDQPAFVQHGRILAAASLFLWSGAIVAGRLMAYDFYR